ncbi:MAG: hypothetical protein NXI32_16195 [bacterium]|nr:hypothetical protein [bacterium]
MTQLGKVFVGLILLLSILFFTFSVGVNASHVNTRELAAEYEQQAREAEATNSQLQTLKDNYKTEIEIEQASKRAALAALQTQYEAVEARLLQLEIQAGELRKTLTIAAQTNDSTQKDLRDAADQNRQVRARIEQIKQERDKTLKDLIAVSAEIASLQGVFQSLSERAASMENAG